MSDWFMSSVSITTTFGRFCWAFFRRSAAVFCRCLSRALWHFASHRCAEDFAIGGAVTVAEGETGEPSATEPAQASRAMVVTASAKPALCDRRAAIGPETRHAPRGCGKRGTLEERMLPAAKLQSTGRAV